MSDLDRKTSYRVEGKIGQAEQLELDVQPGVETPTEYALRTVAAEAVLKQVIEPGASDKQEPLHTPDNIEQGKGDN